MPSIAIGTAVGARSDTIASRRASSAERPTNLAGSGGSCAGTPGWAARAAPAACAAPAWSPHTRSTSASG
jgi:hypothetical protein